jgi:hypothetical protein
MTVELHTLTGAYAAHAVSPDEAAEFEAHLADCVSCQLETRELSATVARMGEAEYDAPPAELKSRILAEVSRTRQLPPPGGLHPQVVELAPRRRNRLTLMVAASVAALAIIGGGIAGGIAVRADHRTQQVQAASAAIASVLSAPDARAVSANGPASARATAVVSDARQAAVFSAAGMPAASAGHVWQLWVIDASGARSIGLLTRHTDGSVSPVVAHGVPAVSASFGVTLEPAGGSKQPTTTPVLLMPIHA